jgi:outer membrane protein TolC
MTVFRHINYALSVYFLLAIPQAIAVGKDYQPSQLLMPMANPEPTSTEHIDSVELDPNLTLAQLLESTLDKYPDRLINEALTEEAAALHIRSDSLLAGSTQISVNYSDDKITTNRGYNETNAELEFTPWDWGQRDAAKNVADQAQFSAEKQSQALKLEVARLLRESLWDMALAENRLQQAKYSLDISAQLLEKVRRRVELGDLARADLLLAETEHLQNRNIYTQAQAEMMHSRKNYASLTRTNHVPTHYQEQLSSINVIRPEHPLLEAINAIIARKHATIEWAKHTDTINQPKINLGTNISHDPFGAGTSQTTGIGVIIPFGHATYDAPEVAAAHLELNRALSQREHVIRQLEKNLHEAEHALEISHSEIAIGNELKQIAQTHLNMTETSFAAGEVNLLDLLKIQARSLEAIRNAKEQEVKLQRNIALYNQAVGVLP